jgi:hypothetical protein
LSRGDNSLPPGLLFFAKMLRSTSSLSHTCWISYFSIRLSHEGITGTVNRRRIDFTSTFNPTDSFPKVRVPFLCHSLFLHTHSLARGSEALSARYQFRSFSFMPKQIRRCNAFTNIFFKNWFIYLF